MIKLKRVYDPTNFGKTPVYIKATENDKKVTIVTNTYNSAKEDIPNEIRRADKDKIVVVPQGKDKTQKNVCSLGSCKGCPKVKLQNKKFRKDKFKASFIRTSPTHSA